MDEDGGFPSSMLEGGVSISEPPKKARIRLSSTPLLLVLIGREE
jgi:hypothetical protein